MSEYFSILTEIGLQKLAIAAANGETLALAQMAFSNGTTEISSTDTALASEAYRMDLTRVDAVGDNVHAEAVIPMDTGGFWIRKIAIFDDSGDMIAIGKYPATYKPLPDDGAVKELSVRMILRVSNAAEVIIAFNNGIIEGANTNLDNLTFVGQQKFDDKADIDSPAFTGAPTAPTAAAGTNTGQLATTAFVAAAINALVGGSSAALDTLQELAAALGNDPNFATTITNVLTDITSALETKAAIRLQLQARIPPVRSMCGI